MGRGESAAQQALRRAAGAGSPTDVQAAGATPGARLTRGGSGAATPGVTQGRTPARSKSGFAGGAAGTPLGPLPSFGTRARRAGQSRSEPTTPRGSRPSSLADSEVSANLADLLDEEAGRTADNVRVLVRIRPLNEREQREAGGRSCLEARGKAVVLSDPARGEPFLKTFDHVFPPEASQEEVHAVAGASAVQHCLAGYNSSIFAYGQTGSGKTYTMQGGEEDSVATPGGRLPPSAGLIPRVFEDLFSRIGEEEQDNANLRYSVKCSFLEVYNEEISDLLAPASTGLQIRDGDLARGVYVERLAERSVLNAEDVMGLIQQGSTNRHIAATKMNERSSRSHSVFTAHITAHEKTPTGLTNVRYSKLNLIDLAGSERVGRSGATGDQLAEAKNINKSLTVLGRVISALVERQRKPHTHVPYRDSRLTFLLQESLGGNSRSTIIANVTPSADCAAESQSTLVFAAGAKRIRNHAVVNQDTLGDMKALQLENARLQRQLSELQARQAEAAESAALAEAEARVAELQRALARAEEEEETQRSLFDQNCQEIQTLKLQNGLVLKELAAEKAAAAQLREERAALRSDNAALGAEVAALQGDAAGLRQALEASTSAAQVAEKEAGALRLELESKEAELRRCQGELEATRAAAEAELHTVLAELDAGSAALKELQREREELERTLARAQHDLEESEGRQARMAAENEALYQSAQAMRRDAEQLKASLSNETVAVAKYKRMVGEISKLIDWAQAASSPGGRGGGTSPSGGLLARRSSSGGAGRVLSPLGSGGSSANVENMLAVAAAAGGSGKQQVAGSPGKEPAAASQPARSPLSPSKIR